MAVRRPNRLCRMIGRVRPLSRTRGAGGERQPMAKKNPAASTNKTVEALTDADRTKADIVAVAMEEFAQSGLAGARVDAIADRTRTSKRMIYYYFGSKEGLYRAVLEQAYNGIRTRESQTHLRDLPPREALRRLIEITFDYDESHHGFIRLIAVENIHYAEHLKKLNSIRGINVSAIEIVEDILARGRAAGTFRADINAFDLHLLISSFCFFRVSNRHTVGAIFKRDLSEPRTMARHRRLIIEAVERLVLLDPAGTGP
ncbi:MAG TPA: TetR/AcrR family transcriptional regulator [Steroidobacteraceae bacterium]|nr:TetR/AcrR family transcriptional regulator [Steroidobacteraceae bacterium]